MADQAKYESWVTLFDDPEDDLFDGDIGIDDAEFPRTHCTFIIDGGAHLSPKPMRIPDASPVYQEPEPRILANSQSPQIRDSLHKKLQDFKSEDHSVFQAAEDHVVNKKMTDLTILIRDRIGKQYPSIILLASEPPKERAKVFQANVTDTVRKYYGDNIWTEASETRSIGDYDQDLENLTADGKRLAQLNAGLAVKKRAYGGLEREYVDMSRNYYQSVLTAQRTIDQMLLEQDEDQQEIARQHNNIRVNQETIDRMIEDHDHSTNKIQDYITMRIEHHKLQAEDMLKVIDGLNSQVDSNRTVIETQYTTEKRLEEKLKDVEYKLQFTVTDIRNMKQKIEEKQAEVDAITRQLNQRIDDVNNANTVLSAANAENAATLRNLKDEKRNLIEEIADLKSKLADASERLEATEIAWHNETTKLKNTLRATGTGLINEQNSTWCSNREITKIQTLQTLHRDPVLIDQTFALEKQVDSTNIQRFEQQAVYAQTEETWHHNLEVHKKDSDMQRNKQTTVMSRNIT